MSVSRQPLITKVISTTGEEVTVYSRIDDIKEKDGCKYRECYAAITTDTGSVIGQLDIHIYDEPYRPEKPGYNCYLNKEGLILPHIHINYIENLSRGNYSHVGNALNELAFRISIMHGFEGRITLEAVRATHYFHFKNGFHLNYNIEYYLSLAAKVYSSNGARINIGNGDAILYLPKDIIERKCKQFCLEVKDTISATETVEENKWIQHFEELLIDAQQRSMPFQVIHALTKDFGQRIDYPVTTVLERFHSQMKNGDAKLMLMMEEGAREEKYKKKNRSLYNEKTRMILKNGIYLLVQLLPADTVESERKFAEILMGTMSLAMMYQDKKFKTQARYSNTLFFPRGSFKKVTKSHESIPAQICALGKAILTDKKFAGSPAINTEFFPEVALISGVQALLLRQSANIKASDLGSYPVPNF